MNEWNYHIIDKAGNSYQIENGMVVAIGNYKPLKNTPIGWQDISLFWERSATKYGLTRSFTLPLGFVIEGQSILSYLNWSNNFDQLRDLLINRRTLYLDTDQYYFFYKFFYKGELDFSTYKYDNDNQRADINIMEGGLSKLFNANQDTVYENPLNDSFVWVKYDGITIDSLRNFKNPTQTITALSSPDFSVPLINLPGENDGVGVIGQNQTETDPHTGMLLWADPIQVHLQGSIKVKVNDQVKTLRFLLDRLATDFTPTNIRYEDFSPNTTDTFEFVINDDFTFAPGEQLLLFIIALADNIAALPAREFTFIETNLTATFKARGAVSYVKVKLADSLFRELTEKVTTNADDFQSDVITVNKAIGVTSGDGIRGIEGAVIKCSYNQAFNSYNVVLNLGLGIENNKIRIEEKAHFFQTDNPIQLGQIKQYKDNWAQDFLFNTVNIGYPDVNIEEVNGKYAFNTSVIWSSPVKRIKKELTLKSDFKADPFEQELLRIKSLGQVTTDQLQDNDVYFVKIDLSAPEVLDDGRTVYPLYRKPGITITGVPNGDTLFNVDLSPRRLMNVHANWLAGVFSGFEGGVLHFESTQRNRNLVADGIDEDADIPISSLGVPLFKPVNFDFLSPFLPVGDLTMNSIYAYKENQEWLVSGGDPNDTSNPYQGTKAIKVTSNISPVTILTAPEAIPFSILNEINFYLKLGAAVPLPTILRIQFIKGSVTARSVNASFSRNSLVYQHVIANSSSFQVIDSTLTDFDSIRIVLTALGGATMYIDNIQLSINPQNDLPSIMDENPNRCFEFIHPNGKKLKGHSLKVGAAPNTEQEQGFLLLATGYTNMEDLII